MIIMPINSWSDFKNTVFENKNLQIQYIERLDSYDIYAEDGTNFIWNINLSKDLGADVTDFENNYKSFANKKIITEISTQFERSDIVLKISKAEATFDVNNQAEITIKVPGTPGTTDGRYVAGGYAFTNGFDFGDKVTKIQVVDVDNILGYGAEFVVKTYHDTDVDVGNAGWYMWPAPQQGGEVEIDPMGYYGFIPAGLYLEVYFEKTADSPATKVFCDIWWGKSE